MAQTGKRAYQHEQAFDSGHLAVGSIHKVYYAQYGKSDGKPIVFVHGGPGGSSRPKNAQSFDPAVFRVILIDQRGCGKSTPVGETRDNTSMNLVADMEAVRQHLGIARWHVFGASWGTTVAMMYVQAHPEAVVSVTLRGVSFWETKEVHDFNAAFERTRLFRPDLYDQVVAPLSEEERKDINAAYSKRAQCGDREIELAAIKMIDRWAGQMAKLLPNPDEDEVLTKEEEDKMIASSRIECHYHANHLWLNESDYLSPAKVDRIKHIPCTIVNGRYDLICPPIAAWELHKKLPNSKIFFTPDAGHSAAETGTQNKLVDICDELAAMPI